MKYLKRKFLRREEWREAIEACRARYAAIEDRLPESARLFHRHCKRHPLHDESVLAIRRPAQDVLQVELGTRTLEFLGVRACEYPESIWEAEVWLYDELDLAAAGALELRALFQVADFRVVAREVRVFDKRLGRHVVPEEPVPPEPTLFLDRKTRRSRRSK